MSDPLVTIVTPTIPPRAHLLQRALVSIRTQTHQPVVAVVEVDHDREGAAAVRNRALTRVETPFVGFLDDDDELLPHHVSACLVALEKTGADLVYPWFVPSDGRDPLPGKFGRPFNRELMRTENFVPVTVLARTESVRSVGGFIDVPNSTFATWEDWGCWKRMLAAGARFVHLPERTWIWHRHEDSTGGNTNHW